MSSIKNSNSMTASSLIDQLLQQGVRLFCTAPGSRSTPLVQACLAHPKAEVYTHFDERGLAFFALGLSKATQNPTAIIVTSGTAVGNLLPAVMEAHHSYISLILLTADRPPELRDTGANQTTDQIKIFQPFVRWQVDLQSNLEDHVIRSIAAQGFFYSKQCPGPVHINCPFKEPLYQSQIEIHEKKEIHLHFACPKSDSIRTPYAKGLILIGSLPKKDDIHPILDLAQRLNWPVCADILSNARLYPTPQQIQCYDCNETPTPEIVLHFGQRLTSKKRFQGLFETIHISPYPELQDPDRILTRRVQSDIGEFCSTFEAQQDPIWLNEWKKEIPQIEKSTHFTEVHAMRSLCEILPSQYGVFLGNGMPIRDANHFLFPKKCEGFFANRGLSGIDGNIATIAALAEKRPMLGIIGDQAALYDLNSIPLLKKTKFPAILLIFNNFGGGIFHYLPVFQSVDFEKYWAGAHSFTFQKIAEMFEIPYLPFEKIFQNEASSIVELITDRKINHEYQTKCFNLKF